MLKRPGRSPLNVFGEAVRAIRLERGLTQQELADRCAFNRTFIVAVEHGRQNCSLISLLKIAKGLNVLPAELFASFSKSVMRSVT